MENNSFVIERTYKAPIDKVWHAISDADQMRNWYFDLPEFRAEVGFSFTFLAGDEQNKYQHLCTVTRVIPGKLLAYTWQYEGVDNRSEVTFELIALDADKTQIVLTHVGVDGFAAGMPGDPNFKRESFAAGWTEIIGTSLKKYVEAH